MNPKLNCIFVIALVKKLVALLEYYNTMNLGMPTIGMDWSLLKDTPELRAIEDTCLGPKSAILVLYRPLKRGPFKINF